MATAILLLNADMGHEKEILAALRAIENVKEAHQVYGVYDMIARVEADSMELLKQVISEKVRKLDRVRSTLTMITE
jgi:DNA-binding Lrp family transcriptional regulator